MIEPAHPFRRMLLAAVALCLLGACAHRGTTVVLLPAHDGAKTAVAVTEDEKEIVLDQPYAAVRPSWLGAKAYTSNPGEVQARFGPTLGALPSRPASFILYFVEGKDELAEESKAVVEGVFAEIAKRPVPDVIVIGHTDTVGSDRSNDALALQRAEVIRKQLVERGVPAANILAIGRGKRELLVRTEDGVAEPRNRRVQIVVR